MRRHRQDWRIHSHSPPDVGGASSTIGKNLGLRSPKAKDLTFSELQVTFERNNQNFIPLQIRQLPWAKVWFLGLEVSIL